MALCAAICVATQQGLHRDNLPANPSPFRATRATSPPPPQTISFISDYAWFVGSSALLLSLPVLVEIQRESTILMLQRQREQEVAQMQEQARALNASTLDNLRATASMIMGSGPPPPPGEERAGGAGR